MTDFSILRRSRVTQTEFGAVLKVSRVTVSNWTRGAGIHEARKPKVDKLLAALGTALTDGKLPLPSSVPPGERVTEIKKVIASYLKPGT